MTPNARTKLPKGYHEAVEAAAVLDRSGRGRLRMHGRSPAQMLDGIVTNRLPGAFAEEDDLLVGSAPYGAILTPKGKMVTDLRVLRAAGPEEAFLLDLPEAGVEGALGYFRKYLPPRLAKVEDVSAETGMLSVVGPDAHRWIAGEVLSGTPSSRLRAMAEGEVLIRKGGEGAAGYVIRGADVTVPAYDILAPSEVTQGLLRRFSDAKLPPLGHRAWKVLRLEHGRANFGDELDEDTIPVEAGLGPRAIDDGKGCYTGQEVIVRIRDRGKVNRQLRGLLMGDVRPPEAGTELYIEGRKRAAGVVRSAAFSPRFGQTIGLGYVRRELDPPGRARLGEAEGPEIEVRGLAEDGWVLVEGDPGRSAESGS